VWERKIRFAWLNPAGSCPRALAKNSSFPSTVLPAIRMNILQKKREERGEGGGVEIQRLGSAHIVLETPVLGSYRLGVKFDNRARPFGIPLRKEKKRREEKGWTPNAAVPRFASKLRPAPSAAQCRRSSRSCADFPGGERRSRIPCGEGSRFKGKRGKKKKGKRRGRGRRKRKEAKCKFSLRIPPPCTSMTSPAAGIDPEEAVGKRGRKRKKGKEGGK